MKKIKLLNQISKEEFDALVASTKLITSVESLEFDVNDADCVGGVCPIR